MSKITREALLAMGFDDNAGILSFTDGMWLIQFMPYGNLESHVGTVRHCPEHRGITTIPQLRQLIRSLFGDDALPRRELSSITDEELIGASVAVWPYSLGFPRRTVHMDGDVGSVYGVMDNGEVAVRPLFCIVVQTGKLVSVPAHSALRAYGYLTNDCDFHLPAFHAS